MISSSNPTAYQRGCDTLDLVWMACLYFINPFHIHYLNLNLMLMVENEAKINSKRNQTLSTAGRIGGGTEDNCVWALTLREQNHGHHSNYLYCYYLTQAIFLIVTQLKIIILSTAHNMQKERNILYNDLYCLIFC